MDEFRSMRDDIKETLAQNRKETREDIKDLHSKLDKRFFMLDKKLDEVSTDVTTHKAHLKTFAAFVTIAFGAVVSWVTTKLGGV